MSKRSVIVSALLLSVLFATSLCSTASASAHPRALAFRVIKHAHNYDVVRGHHRTLVVYHRARYVSVHRTPRYRVVRRRHRTVVLRRLVLSGTAAFTNAVALSGSPAPFGLPAAASSSQSGNPPSAADDGRATTRWAAGNSTFPQWWMVDLGGVATVNGVKINWYKGNARAYRYRIQTSSDGLTFTTAVDRSTNQQKGVTTDAMNVGARYVRVQVLGTSSKGAWASAYEITVYDSLADPAPDPTPTATPTATPTPTATLTVVPTPDPTVTPTASPSSSPTQAAAPAPTPSPTATVAPAPSPVPSAGPVITSLSATNTAVGARLTISGSGFGATQDSSHVYFGEYVNPLGFRPATKEAASYISWSDSQIVVTVPSMAPGAAGQPYTYHPVYVQLGDSPSNRADFFITPAHVISGQTFTTASAYGNDVYALCSSLGLAPHDVLFDHCTFTATNTAIHGDLAGVLTLGFNGQPTYDVTFLNCTVNGNTGAGGGSDYGVNGVKLLSGGGCTHDITFADCWIRRCSRMGFETWWDSTPGTNFILGGCVFEAMGDEAISWGDSGATYSLVDGCTCKGSGQASTSQYGSMYECNQTSYVETRNSTFYGPGGFNLSGTGTNQHLYFDNDVMNLDLRSVAGQVQAGHASDFTTNASWLSSGFISYMPSVVGSRWDNCSFDMGTTAAGTPIQQAFAATYGTASNNDFSSSTVAHLSHTYGGMYDNAGAGNTWPTSK